jgi:mannosyltransferase
LLTNDPAARFPGQRRPPDPKAPPQQFGDVETTLLPRQDDLTIPPPQSAESVSQTRLLGAVGVASIEEGSAARRRALAHLAWLLATVMAGTIELVRVTWPAASADELATWGMVTTPWDRMWGVLQHTDIVFWPYYSILHVWVSLFGASDFQMRLPSVLAMAAAAGLVARIGTRLGSPRIGLFSGLLFAALPTTSRYAQEARPFAMVVFAACLCSLALLRALERPRWRPLMVYALSIMLLGMLHNVALLLLTAHAAVVLFVRRQAILRWLLATIVGALPGLAILYLGHRQAEQISSIPSANLHGLAYPEALVGASVVAGMLLMLAIFSLSVRHPAVLYTSWAILPMITLAVIARFTPLWLPQYLLFTLPAWCLLAGVALGRTRVVRGVIAVILIGVIGLGAQAAIRTPDGHSHATRDAAKLISANTQPDDGIVFAQTDAGGGWVGRGLYHHYVPASRRPVDVLVVRPERTDGHFLAGECEDVAKCLGGRKRLWIVRLGRYSDPLQGLDGAKQGGIGHLYYSSQIWYPKGLTVALMVLKPTS